MAIVKSFLRWTYRIFWYSLVTIIICLAIAITLARIFIPDIKIYREKVEHIASAFMDQEVRIDSMDARLSGITPVITFKGVHMLDHTGKHEIMQFDEARLGLDLLSSVSNRKVIPESLTVYGVKLGITRRKDHTLVLQGLKVKKFEQEINVPKGTVEAQSSELANWLFKRSTLVLKNSTLVWRDTLHGNTMMRFEDVNIDLRNDGDRHQFTSAIRLPSSMGKDLAIVFDFNGNILDPTKWQGQFYMRGHALQLANWVIKPTIRQGALEQGVLNAELWGHWQNGEVTELTSNIAANDLRLSVSGKPQPLNIQFASGLFDWRRQGRDWQLNIDNFVFQGQSGTWPTGKVNLLYHHVEGQPDSIDAYTKYVQLADTVKMINALGLLDTSTSKLLKHISPDGELRDLHVQYQSGNNANPRIAINTHFKDLSINAYKNFPGVAGLDGEIWADQQHGTIKFNDDALRVAFPMLFRDAFDLTRLQGDVQWWHAYDAWYVDAPALAVASADIQTNVATSLTIPDGRASPVLELGASFSNGDAQHTSRYLPVGIMDKHLVDWLDHGILNGRVKQGNVLFQGRVADFPFHRRSGTFVVDFQGENVLLNYRDGWPRILANDINARFTSKGMALRVPVATLYHTRMHDIAVDIQNFMLPLLKVKGSFVGDSNDAVRFLVESPIAPEAAAFYKQSQISGQSNGQLSLSIPLSKDAEKRYQTDYAGYVQLQKSQLYAWGDRLVVTNISGRLDFSPAGVFAKQLDGIFTGQPLHTSLVTREVKQQQIIDLNMQGTLDTASLVANFPMNGVEKRIHGKTHWGGVLSFGDESGQDRGKVSLQLHSHLLGIGLDFPPPLHKAPQDYQDFELKMSFSDNGNMPFDVKMGNMFNAALLLQALPEQPLQIKKGVIAFSSEQAVLPEQAQLVIRGSIPVFPLDEWQDIKRQLTTADNAPALDNLTLPIILDLGYLNISSHKDVLEAAYDDPRKVPLVNGEIHDLVYNDSHFGHVMMKTKRDPEGIRMEDFKLEAPFIQITGKGSWLVRHNKQRTNFLLSLKSDNVENMIASLGYKGVIKKGKAKLAVQLNWPDAPYRLKLAKLNGTVGIAIEDGTLREVDPGAGKVLGLLSLSELPRRLMLDFSDMGKGLQFKQILGQLDILDGDAFTENLRIVSPIALIQIDGRTGLAKRDYDLDVSVAPNVSSTLPVISWLAWGIQVGAVTYVMDKLFGKEFNESIATVYRVTGSWEHPQIKTIRQANPQEQENK